MKRERANETNVAATLPSPCFLWRKQVMTELMMMYTVKGTREYSLRKAVTKAVAVVLNTAWGTKNKRAFKVTIMVGGI